MYVFVGFSRIFLLGILIFKGLTARRLYKSFGVKWLNYYNSTSVGWKVSGIRYSLRDVRTLHFTTYI
jgi:hypothetical protein